MTNLLSSRLSAGYFATDPFENVVVALRSRNIRHPTDAATVLVEPVSSLVEGRIDEAVALTGRTRPFLEEAISESRLTFTVSNQSVRSQHYVSATILRGFQEETSLGRRLLRYDLRCGFAKGLQSASSTFRWRDFVKIDSSSTEKLWSSVENRIPDLISELEQTEPERISNASVDMLIDVVALHLARSLLTREIHEHIWRVRTANIAEELVPDDVAIRYFIGRHNLYPPTVAVARQLFVQEFHGRSVTRLESGITFRLRVVSAFRDYQLMLREGDVRIFHCNASEELVLGDVPTLNLACEEVVEESDLLPKIDGRAIFMPLTPKIGVAIVGKRWRNSELLEDVAALNEYSLRFARTRVVMRPSSGLESWCANIRPTSSATHHDGLG
jgi:hypothetical protein